MNKIIREGVREFRKKGGSFTAVVRFTNMTSGVVLFSDGVFAKYSYSIFAILNSFEGLFLFIYFFIIDC
ncbi:unnamed protein product [Boreogadus saida]